MNISFIAFAICAGLTTAFLAAMTIMESGTETNSYKQSGDTTIGRNSINWIGGIALAAAVLICFFLM